MGAQEENLQRQLEELRAKKDKVTLEMRSAAINKKLQFENCERVVKQLKDQLAALGAEKNELDVQSEIIRQQVNNYTEMRRGLVNVKLNDLKSTIRIFEQEQYSVDYSESNTNNMQPQKGLVHPNNAMSNAPRSRPAEMKHADQLDIFDDLMQPSQ